jgi:hypothetical protein
MLESLEVTRSLRSGLLDERGRANKPILRVRVVQLTKRAALGGGAEKPDPNRRQRGAPGESAQQWPPPERGVFRKYWPILRVRAVPLSTGGRRRLIANKFGSPNNFRTRDRFG